LFLPRRFHRSGTYHHVCFEQTFSVYSEILSKTNLSGAPTFFGGGFASHLPRAGTC
jgi:hypothetical protein